MYVLELALVAGVLLGNPQGATFVSGTAAIETAGKTLTVRQSTNQAVINWQRFENTATETIRFQQPGVTSLTVNRVVGADPSAILGSLSANGRIFILNPNGVVFGPNARVDVGSLVASTLSISDPVPTNGTFRLRQTGRELGAVVNQGKITAAAGGTVALVAPIVSNEGTILAPAGSVFVVGTTDGTIILDPVSSVTSNVSVEPNTGGRVPTFGLSPLLSSVIDTSSIAKPPLLGTGGPRVEKLADGTTFLRGAGGIVVNGGTIDTRGASAGQVRLEGINSVALSAGSRIEGGTGPVTIKAVKGDVYEHRLANATSAPAIVRGSDITVNADEGRIRTTDARDLRFEATNKVTLRGRDRVGRTDLAIQVKAAHVDVVASNGEASLFVDGDTTVDQVKAGVDNNLGIGSGVTLEFVSSGTVLGKARTNPHLAGFHATIDIAGDAGDASGGLLIASGARNQVVNVTVGGTRFPQGPVASVRFVGRITNQDQFNSIAAGQSPAARSTYSPPVDAPDAVPPAPVTADPVPVVLTAPTATLADSAPASSGPTVGQADNVLLPALRTDRARTDSDAAPVVADASGGLIDVVSTTPAATDLDGAVAAGPAPTRDDRLAQVRRRVAANRTQPR